MVKKTFFPLIYIHCVCKKQQLAKKLKRRPDTFEDLKCVLSTISDIRSMSLDVEIRFTDIQERYRTLAMHNVTVMYQISDYYGGKLLYSF